MIWLTWRQFRLQAWVTAAVVLVVAVALAVTGPALHDLYRTTGLEACTTGCGDLLDSFRTQIDTRTNEIVYILGIGTLFLLPALIGVFWGAPLVSREFEVGTHRLVWNQTVSRARWLAVKLAGLGLATAVTAGVVTFAVTWWSVPADRAAGGRLTPLLFAARGIVPIGYALFAFVLGVTIGLLTRRLLVSMAVTLLLVATAQLLMPYAVRPHLGGAVTGTVPFSPQVIKSLGISPDLRVSIQLEPPVEGAWVLSNATYDRNGNLFTGPVDATRCGMRGSPDECHEWLVGQGLQQRITYLPPERFWTLQWREFALFAVASAMLSLFCIWWIRRRVA